jgi:hypothetical protein
LSDEWLEVGIPEIEIPWQQQLLAHDVPVSGYSQATCFLTYSI